MTGGQGVLAVRPGLGRWPAPSIAALAVVAVAIFLSSGLAYYHVVVGGVRAPAGWLQGAVVGLYRLVGFAPSLFLALLALVWGFLFFVNGRTSGLWVRAAGACLFCLTLAILTAVAAGHPAQVQAPQPGGAVGAHFGTRLGGLLGPGPAATLMALLAGASLVLATDWFFYRYFRALVPAGLPVLAKLRRPGRSSAPGAVPAGPRTPQPAAGPAAPPAAAGPSVREAAAPPARHRPSPIGEPVPIPRDAVEEPPSRRERRTGDLPFPPRWTAGEEEDEAAEQDAEGEELLPSEAAEEEILAFDAEELLSAGEGEEEETMPEENAAVEEEAAEEEPWRDEAVGDSVEEEGSGTLVPGASPAPDMEREEISEAAGETVEVEEEPVEPAATAPGGPLEEAVELVLANGRASVSFLQRKLRIRFAEASDLLDAMEGMGVIGPYREGAQRAVLMTLEEWRARRGA